MEIIRAINCSQVVTQRDGGSATTRRGRNISQYCYSKIGSAIGARVVYRVARLIAAVVFSPHVGPSTPAEKVKVCYRGPSLIIK